jgi:hypothetical protein
MPRKKAGEAGQRQEARTPGEPRVRLRVMLKLRSTHTASTSEVLTSTEAVSASGFLCGYQAQISEGATVEVYLVRNAQHPVGQAKAVRIDWPGTAGQRVDFAFIERPTDWILRWRRSKDEASRHDPEHQGVLFCTSCFPVLGNSFPSLPFQIL